MLPSQQVHFNLKALSIKSSNLNSWQRNQTFINSPTKMAKIVREMAELDGNNSTHFEGLPKTHPSAHSALKKDLQTVVDYNA
jgi:hypothetical protein